MKKRNSLLALFIVLIVVLATVLSGCVNDVIELSPEEEEKWMEDQTALFADVELSDFDVKTIDGQTANAQDCFGAYKLTMVNIWGTFCGPCIDEMPDIAALYNNRPEGVNIISICTDAGDSDENLRFANEVIEKANAGFCTLIPDKTLSNLLTARVTAFPTTIFVDSNGKIVGTPHFGAQDESSYREAISERLSLLEGDQYIPKEQQP